MTTIAGIILAGGRSSRLGGAPKALADLGGQTLVERAVLTMAPQVGRLAVNLPPHIDAPLPPTIAIIRDATPAFDGPLAGVLAGLRWAATLVPAVSHLASVPVDLPFLPADLVARLGREIGGGDVVVLAEGPSGRAPLAALWPLAVAPALAAFLADPAQRRVQAFLGGVPVRTVVFAPRRLGRDDVDPFFNVNTPADLALAGALACQ